MSGGGSKNETAAVATAPAAAPVQMIDYQAYMPGQQSMLASQLAAGFGGTPASYQTGILAQNQPMTIPLIGRPSDLDAYMKKIGVTPATIDTKKG